MVDPLTQLPDELSVCIEVTRWSFLKRKADGRIDLVSPLPCPWNYGSVLGVQSPDGDPLDALVLGPAIPRGHVVSIRVRAVMGFVDAGVADPKVICSAEPLTASERAAVHAFFVVYAGFKRVRQRIRRQRGTTACTGWLTTNR